MPPQTTTTSAPAGASTSHALPNGPRTPTTSPGSAAQIACVARPTARTVWRRRDVSAGSPLIEIGTSPAPPLESIVNCPGAKRNPSPPSGSSSSVQVSAVSRRLATTANGAGTISAGIRSAGNRVTIDVEQLEACGLQALLQRGRKATHQLIAELVIGVALAAQACTVERDETRRHGRASVEVPVVGREQPRPADDIAVVQRLDDE